MAVAQQYVARQSGGRGGPSGLADVLDVLLDKGLVIDAFVRVSLVGIELLTIDARIVIAGVDTYLHFAEAVNRLDLLQAGNSQTVPELVGGGGRSGSRSSGGSRPGGGRQSDGGQNDEDESSHDEPRELEHSNANGGGERDTGGDDNGGKGLLSRLVDRGQAF